MYAYIISLNFVTLSTLAASRTTEDKNNNDVGRKFLNTLSASLLDTCFSFLFGRLLGFLCFRSRFNRFLDFSSRFLGFSFLLFFILLAIRSVITSISLIRITTLIRIITLISPISFTTLITLISLLFSFFFSLLFSGVIFFFLILKVEVVIVIIPTSTLIPFLISFIITTIIFILLRAFRILAHYKGRRDGVYFFDSKLFSIRNNSVH
mmetsp:Transcript_589/g.734  ORF Transcript_589/g.734 Transcript_589/m.734 type:complete len:208 (+) Transcript_589:6168-6791(+)